MSFPRTKYLLDANIFIQGKHLYYRFEFCQGFWDWIIQAHQADIVFSIDKVKAELKNGKEDDSIRMWMDKAPDSFFLPDLKDLAVINAYRQIMIWTASNNHYTQQAKDEFARPAVADAFLIAVAKTHDYTIVTHEKSQPGAKKRILIPDAANAFDVKSIMIYELLSLHAEGSFSLKT